MSRRRLRLVAAAGALLVLVTTAIVMAVVTGPSGAPAVLSEEVAELSPAMAGKLAQQQKFAPPGSKQEGERSAADDEWMKHAIPGDTIPSAAIEGSSSDWAKLSSLSAKGAGKWKPLGPTWAKGLPNPYRDRAVYNGGTPDFSGRIAHTVIDPNCDGNRGNDDDDDRGGSCRLWIANANGGVWLTNNALGKRPQWKYVSEDFEHNSIASLELDPNDKRSNTIYAGTGEPNACGSGCEAGVGIYKSTNGGERWSGPFGTAAGPACGPGNPSPCNPFYNRAVGSIEVKPGDSNTIFAATGRAIRGLTSSCCGGADALIPGAAHFGLYRSQDGGENWTLVHQGAPNDCTASTPDQVSLSGTPCSPRGARRVYIDPVDPNTVYVSFFGRGIWRSKANGNPGTFEQIMLPVGPAFATAGGGSERAEFDIVNLPSGETRMYVGVGGGSVPFARFRRNDAVRNAPAATVAASWVDLTSAAIDTPGYSSFNYCGQCSYDNYVFAPARHFPNSGASPDVVYLSGDNRYAENDWGPASPRANAPGNVTGNGRDSGRAVVLTTNGGAAPGTQYFTDMTEDTTHNIYPVALHPDHHALTVNPRDYRQFFDVGDGGIIRSNGRFVDDSGDCVQPKGYTGSALTFCQLMLSRVPERLEAMNKGLRTLHFYQLDVSPFDDDTIVGGTQDNGSWERGDGPGSGTNSGPNGALPAAGVGIDTDEFPSSSDCLGRGRGDDDDDDDNGNSGSRGEQVWVNTNIADGGHNGFDLGDPCFRLSGFQQGQTMVSYDPKNQLDMNWTSDTHFVLYGGEANAFIGVANDDHTVAHRLWSARQHAFRSDNQGRNPILTKQTHREHCNVWYGDADVDDNGVYEPAKDLCDDWMPLGDPGPNGRLTSAAFGATKQGGYVSVIEPAWDGQTLWTATQVGRVLVSKNAGGPEAAVTFDRIDDDATALPNAPNRFVSAIYVDPKDANHAWIVYSGFNAKDPIDGHVFEVRYVPGASTFKLLDGNEPRDRMGDIPATSVAVTDKGTIYVGTDYGIIASDGDGVWREAGKGLPRMPAADLLYIPGEKKLYAATHGQGVWELKVRDIEDDDDD